LVVDLRRLGLDSTVFIRPLSLTFVEMTLMVLGLPTVLGFSVHQKRVLLFLAPKQVKGL
jgi:hypothetical protein